MMLMTENSISVITIKDISDCKIHNILHFNILALIGYLSIMHKDLCRLIRGCDIRNPNVAFIASGDHPADVHIQGKYN